MSDHCIEDGITRGPGLGRGRVCGWGAGLVLLALLSSGATLADTLNWDWQQQTALDPTTLQPTGPVGNPAGSHIYISCDRTAVAADWNCAVSPTHAQPDKMVTPFLQELLTINGIRYYHLIVGGGADPANSDFAQEYFISAMGCCFTTTFNSGSSVTIRDLSSSAGEPSFQYVQDKRLVLPGGSFSVPYTFSDNVLGLSGSANPEQVQFRLRLTDPDPNVFTQTVEKTELANKATITQNNKSTTGTTTVDASVTIDGSALSLRDAASPAIVDNTLTMTDPADPDLRVVAADFKMHSDAQGTTIVVDSQGAALDAAGQTPHVSAGKYSYTPNYVYLSDGVTPDLTQNRGGAEGGTYLYWEDFFPSTHAWTKFDASGQGN